MNRSGLKTFLNRALRHRAPLRITGSRADPSSFFARFKKILTWPMSLIVLVAEEKNHAFPKIRGGRYRLEVTLDGEIHRGSILVPWVHGRYLLGIFPRIVNHTKTQGSLRQVPRSISLNLNIKWQVDTSLGHDVHGTIEISAMTPMALYGRLRGVARTQRFVLGTQFRDAELVLASGEHRLSTSLDLDLEAISAFEEVSTDADMQSPCVVTSLNLTLGFADGEPPMEAQELLSIALHPERLNSIPPSIRPASLATQDDGAHDDSA